MRSASGSRPKLTRVGNACIGRRVGFGGGHAIERGECGFVLTALEMRVADDAIDPRVVLPHGAAAFGLTKRVGKAMLRKECGCQHPARVVPAGIGREHAYEHALGFQGQTGIARHARLSQQRIGQPHRRRGIVRRCGHLLSHGVDRPRQRVTRGRCPHRAKKRRDGRCDWPCRRTGTAREQEKGQSQYLTPFPLTYLFPLTSDLPSTCDLQL